MVVHDFAGLQQNQVAMKKVCTAASVYVSIFTLLFLHCKVLGLLREKGEILRTDCWSKIIGMEEQFPGAQNRSGVLTSVSSWNAKTCWSQISHRMLSHPGYLVSCTTGWACLVRGTISCGMSWSLVGSAWLGSDTRRIWSSADFWGAGWSQEMVSEEPDGHRKWLAHGLVGVGDEWIRLMRQTKRHG